MNNLTLTLDINNPLFNPSLDNLLDNIYTYFFTYHHQSITEFIEFPITLSDLTTLSSTLYFDYNITTQLTFKHNYITLTLIKP